MFYRILRITKSYTALLMADIRSQIVVTSELKGDPYVPLRLQKKNADKADYQLFAYNMRYLYKPEELQYIEAVIKHGIYDEQNDVLTMISEDSGMYNQLMELFKPEFEKLYKPEFEKNTHKARQEAKQRARQKVK